MNFVAPLLLAMTALPSLSAARLVSEDFEIPIESSRFVQVSPVGDGSRLVKCPGTIDGFQGQPGNAIGVEIDFSTSGEDARGGLTVGPVAVAKNDETDLAKLTVSFDLWTNLVRPVRVRIASADAAGTTTGTLTTTVIPPVADAWYRFGLDLGDLTPNGGTFDPASPKLSVTVEFTDTDGVAPLPRTGGHTLRLDNLSYTSPSFYVNPTGSDTASGRSADEAFATIQKAVDAAGPGDVVLVMDGTYKNSSEPDISHVSKEIVNAPVWRPWWVATTGGICRIAKAGTPAAWIVIRAHPGHQPLLLNESGWEAFKIDLESAWIEIRGLTLQGNRAQLDYTSAKADSDITERDGWRYYGNARFNNNGIIVDGRATSDHSRRPHHLRFVENTIFEFPAAGISVIAADYVTVADNLIFDNVNFTRWGASGISFLRAFNFDDSPAHKMFILRNKSFHNECFVPWVRYESDSEGNPVRNDLAKPSTLSDGNGIIVDVNRRRGVASESDFDIDYKGRTLVANNVSAGNGGSGIVITTFSHVDIVNNTLFDNVRTPDLVEKGWGDLMLGGPPPGSTDVRIFNNIVVSRSAPRSFHSHRTDKVVATNNIFFGAPAATADLRDENNRAVDPEFVNAIIDPATADFALRPGSPALDAGIMDPAGIIPADDIDGALRPQGPAPDLGAIESQRDR